MGVVPQHLTALVAVEACAVAGTAARGIAAAGIAAGGASPALHPSEGTAIISSIQSNAERAAIMDRAFY